jgi:hypothetical protein
MSRPPRPPGVVSLRRLIGRRELLERDARRQQAAGLWCRAHDREPGLTPFTEAVTLWAAVRRGEFPQPLRGPWGMAWCADAVKTWRRSRGLM